MKKRVRKAPKGEIGATGPRGYRGDRGDRGYRGGGDRVSEGRDEDMRRFWNQYPHISAWIIVGLMSILGLGAAAWSTSVYAQIKSSVEATAGFVVVAAKNEAAIDALKREDQMHLTIIADLKSDIKSVQSDLKELLRRTK